MRRKDRKKFEEDDRVFRNEHAIMRNKPGIINNFGLNYVQQPFSKRLNLKVGVSTVLFNLEAFDSLVKIGSWGSDFVEVHRMIFDLEFLDNAVEWGNFADQAALSNGVEIRYTFNGTEINLITTGGGIKRNGDFLEIAHDAFWQQDQRGTTKSNIINTRFSLEKFSDHGIILELSGGDLLTFDVKDDLTAAPAFDNLVDFSVRVQGNAYIKV